MLPNLPNELYKEMINITKEGRAKNSLLYDIMLKSTLRPLNLEKTTLFDNMKYWLTKHNFKTLMRNYEDIIFENNDYKHGYISCMILTAAIDDYFRQKGGNVYFIPYQFSKALINSKTKIYKLSVNDLRKRIKMPRSFCLEFHEVTAGIMKDIKHCIVSFLKEELTDKEQLLITLPNYRTYSLDLKDDRGDYFDSIEAALNGCRKDIREFFLFIFKCILYISSDSGIEINRYQPPSFKTKNPKKMKQRLKNAKFPIAVNTVSFSFHGVKYSESEWPRDAHFRWQAYGPQWSLRRLIMVSGTMCKRDQELLS